MSRKARGGSDLVRMGDMASSMAVVEVAPLLVRERISAHSQPSHTVVLLSTVNMEICAQR